MKQERSFCLWICCIMAIIGCASNELNTNTTVVVSQNTQSDNTKAPKAEIPASKAEIPSSKVEIPQTPNQNPNTLYASVQVRHEGKPIPDQTPEDMQRVEPFPRAQVPNLSKMLVENFIWRSQDKDFAMEARRVGSSYIYDAFSRKGPFRICYNPQEASVIAKGFVNFATDYKVLVRTGTENSAVNFAEVTVEVQMYPKNNPKDIIIKTQRGIAAGLEQDKKPILFKALRRAIDRLAIEFALQYPVRGFITETRGNRTVAKVNIGRDFGVEEGDFVEIFKNGSCVSSGIYLKDMVFPGYGWVQCDASTASEIKSGLPIVYRPKAPIVLQDRDIVREDIAIASDIHLLPLKPSEQEMIALNNPDAEMQIAVWVDKKDHPVYYLGEKLRIYFRAAEDCYVKLIALQTDGTEYEFFPNKLHPNNLVQRGRTYCIPDASDPFDITIEPPAGIQRIKVIATKQPLNPPQVFGSGEIFKEAQTKNIQIQLRGQATSFWAVGTCEFEIKNSSK